MKQTVSGLSRGSYLHTEVLWHATSGRSSYRQALNSVSKKTLHRHSEQGEESPHTEL